MFRRARGWFSRHAFMLIGAVSVAGTALALAGILRQSTVAREEIVRNQHLQQARSRALLASVCVYFGRQAADDPPPTTPRGFEQQRAAAAVYRELHCASLR